VKLIAYHDLGAPAVLMRMSECLLDGLPRDLARAWPDRFTHAIRPGADLRMVWPRFGLWLLTEQLPPKVEKYPECAAALAGVARLFGAWIETGRRPGRRQWDVARKAASDATAAIDGADAEAWAALAAATFATYNAPSKATESATYATVTSAVSYFAAAQLYVPLADKLIELLEATGADLARPSRASAALTALLAPALEMPSA
jgi:hypothetical protein